MTAAATPAAPAWLAVGDVKGWLRLSDVVDDDLVASCAAAVEPLVERARPDYQVPLVPTPLAGAAYLYRPGPDAYQAGVMLAARLYRRRNSPAGVESFGDSVVYTARWDADVDRLLHTAGYALPRVG